VAWYGIKSALSSASGKHAFHFDNFASLLLTISFGFQWSNYYSTPIPGIESAFHNLVTNEAQFLSRKIDQPNSKRWSAGCGFRNLAWTPPVGEIFSELSFTYRDHPARAAQAVAIWSSPTGSLPLRFLRAGWDRC